MRILVVEDDKNIAEFLKFSLKAEGFIVDCAQDGESGSYMARTNKYDLVILDNVLPKKDGYQICHEIRADGSTVPIILLSVRSEIETKVKLLNAGVDDYLVKPYSFEELLARIKALLRRPQKIEKEVLMVEDLTLDLNNHTVKRGDKEIQLTLKEFCLLEYLMRNSNKVLSRGMIMEHVWDSDIDPFSNTIETHIFNLRRKIGQGNQKKLIHTVSGRGYKIS